MGASVRSIPKAAGRGCALWGGAVVLALLVGCAETPKDTRPQSNSAPPAGKAQGAKSEQASPAPAAKPAPAAASKEKPAPATDTPIGQKDGDEKSPAGQAGAKPAAEFGPDTKVSTDEDREALAKLILAQAIAAQKDNEAQQPQKPTAPEPAAKPSEKPAASLNAQQKEPQKPAATQPANQPAAKPGCGATSDNPVDLTPPPPDQPQPKLVVKEAKVKADSVWAGKQATFKFDLTNEGEGPLAIRLRGG
jgi:hypothetical protein